MNISLGPFLDHVYTLQKAGSFICVSEYEQVPQRRAGGDGNQNSSAGNCFCPRSFSKRKGDGGVIRVCLLNLVSATTTMTIVFASANRSARAKEKRNEFRYSMSHIWHAINYTTIALIYEQCLLSKAKDTAKVLPC